MPKKLSLEFVEAASPITEFVTKFGGQPVWIGEPQWPLSRETGNPMRFVCQIALDADLFPNMAARMAYFFMTEEESDEFVDGTYDPDGGENAVVLQPGVPLVPTAPLGAGPTLFRMVPKPGEPMLQSEACELRVLTTEGTDPEFVSEDELFKLPPDQSAALRGKVNENKIAGTPVFLQCDQFPFDDGCRLLFQLDACSVPFYVNFGDSGVGYAFLNAEGDEAKFLWQCC
jgi:uncharacterized protein YwqG